MLELGTLGSDGDLGVGILYVSGSSMATCTLGSLVGVVEGGLFWVFGGFLLRSWLKISLSCWMARYWASPGTENG